MSDIQGEIENKAEEAKDSSDDQHLGDAMDEADPESHGSARKSEDGGLAAVDQGGPTQAGGEPQKKHGDALGDVDLEPPSS